MTGGGGKGGGPVACAHCALEVEESRALRDVVDGHPLPFCCPSCLAVHRAVRSASLGAFYGRRRGWTPGPPEAARIDAEAFAAATRPVEGGLAEMVLSLGGIRCASCCWLVERYLARAEGIAEARVNFATGRASVRFDPARIGAAAVAARVAEIGYVPHPGGRDDGTEALRRERSDLLLRFGTAAFLSLQVMMFTTGLYAGHFEGMEPRWRALLRILSVLLCVPVLLYSAAPFARGAVASIRRGAAGMDALVLLGAGSAFAYSAVSLFTGGEIYADTASGVVTLVLLGKVLETGARLSASEGIGRLLRLSPASARRLLPGDGGGAETVPTESLRGGDRVETLPGERFPADGTVFLGETEVDESTLTGEAEPVAKEPGSPVFAGTLNGSGRVRFEVTRAGGDTTLARIARAVEEAASRKAPVQALADRVSAAFVPLVALLAAATALFRLRGGAPPGEALLGGVAVLVVACPCALGLATPLAVTLGASAARARGILVRGGDVLERAASVRTVVVDKTGTLTEGSPRITDVLPAGVSRERFLLLCASLEAPSEHPLSRAFREAAPPGVPLPEVGSFRARPGRGVEGTVDGEPCRLGTFPFLEEGGVAVPGEALEEGRRLASEGKTVAALSGGGAYLGLAALRDALRPGSAEAVRELASLSCPVLLLSGDRPEAAERVAGEAGIGRVRGGVTPEGKEEAVREERRARGAVMMVGDGVNDAVALAGADVGVAVGRSADVASASAGALLSVPDLRLLPRLLRISRRTMAVARQNLFWAFGYNLVAIPLAAAGRLHPLAAAALMALSSLVVTGNSMRLAKEEGKP